MANDQIEIYGFPADKILCPNCMKVVNLCKEKGLSYEFKPVVDDLIGGKIIRNIPNTQELIKRMEWSDKDPINVPQVFANGVHLGGLSAFRMYCKEYCL